MIKAQIAKKFQKQELKASVSNRLRRFLHIDTSNRLVTLSLLSTTTVALSIIGISTYLVARNLILEQIKERAFLKISQATDQINQWIEAYSLAVEFSANTDTVRTMNWPIAQPFLKSEIKQFNDFLFLGLAFPDGRYYNTLVGKGRADLKDRKYFHKAMAGQFNISDPIIAHTVKIHIINIASPIHQTSNPNSPIVGVLFGGLSIKKITQVVNGVSYGRNNYAFLLNSQGQSITNNNPRLILKKQWLTPNLWRSPDPNLADLVKKMLHKDRGLELFNLDGEQKYVAYLPLKKVNWSIALVIPRDNIESQLGLLNTLTFVLTFLLLTILIIFWHQVQLSEKARTQVVLLGEQGTILQEQARELELALQKLEQAQVQLIQKEKMSSLGQLVAGLSHEINQPLSFIYDKIEHVDCYRKDLFQLIKTYQKRLDGELESTDEIDKIDNDKIIFLRQDIPNYLTSMKTEANKLKQIVLSLRTFSRLDEATMKSVDIHESIDSTLLILQSRLTNPDKHQIIQVIKEYGNLPSVECYPSQINQVFLHILSNAIDAMEGLFVGNNSEQSTIAQPLLRVRTELTPEQTVNIAIANNGPSIPKDIQGTVFNPFFTTKPIGQDAGLGLSISYQIVTEVHKGKLILVSTPEQLTEFIIQIPLHQHQIN